MFRCREGLICAAVLLGGVPARAGPGEKPSLVVLDLVSERGIDPGVVRLLNELLLTAFEQTEKYEVIGGSDLKAMLSHERQQDLLGCTDVSCMAQIGGALGEGRANVPSGQRRAGTSNT